MPIKIKIYFNLFITLVLILSALPAYAQSEMTSPAQTESDTLPRVVKDVMPDKQILPDVSILSKTHPEKIVFSQFKLADETPNFDNFAKASPLVINAQNIDKSAMVLSEYNRISNNFNLHNEKQPIVVHTHLKVDQYSSLQNLIMFDELNKKTFFRFQMYDYKVGIVPENITDFSRLAFSKQKAETMFLEIGNDPDIFAEFVLTPIYSDRKEPFFRNDQPYWLMFARIAEFRLWTSDDPNSKLLWYYRAPWYSPNNLSEISGLFSN